MSSTWLCCSLCINTWICICVPCLGRAVPFDLGHHSPPSPACMPGQVRGPNNVRENAIQIPHDPPRCLRSLHPSSHCQPTFTPQTNHSLLMLSHPPVPIGGGYSFRACIRLWPWLLCGRGYRVMVYVIVCCVARVAVMSGEAGDLRRTSSGR